MTPDAEHSARQDVNHAQAYRRALRPVSHRRVTPPAAQEWQVPWEGTRPRDPYVAPNGLVWFVGQEGNYVANLDPKTGKFDRFEITEGTHPHNLVVAPDGDGLVHRQPQRATREARSRHSQAHRLPDARPAGG